MVVLFIVMNIFTAASAAEIPKLTAVCPESVNVGRSFEVMISSNESTSVHAVQMNIFYDSERISFKNVSNIQTGEIEFFDNDGVLGLIFLHRNTISKGELLKLDFTAKTGFSSAESELRFEIAEAVDENRSNTELDITETVSINIIRKGEESASSSSRTGTSRSTSSKLSSSSAISSENEIIGSEHHDPDGSDNVSLLEELTHSRADPEDDFAVSVNEEDGMNRESSGVLSDERSQWIYMFIGALGMFFLFAAGIFGYSLGKRKNGKDVYKAESDEIFERFWENQDK